MKFNSPEFIRFYNHNQRITAVFFDARREVAGEVVHHVSTLPNGGSFVLYSKLDEMTADAVIERQVAYRARF